MAAEDGAGRRGEARRLPRRARRGAGDVSAGRGALAAARAGRVAGPGRARAGQRRRLGPLLREGAGAGAGHFAAASLPDPRLREHRPGAGRADAGRDICEDGAGRAARAAHGRPQPAARRPDRRGDCRVRARPTRSRRQYFAAEQIPVEYDWHYQHNLDLLATSYQYVGQMAKAEALFKRVVRDPFVAAGAGVQQARVAGVPAGARARAGGARRGGHDGRAPLAGGQRGRPRRGGTGAAGAGAVSRRRPTKPTPRCA